jgi:hypothetical protein
MIAPLDSGFGFTDEKKRAQPVLISVEEMNWIAPATLFSGVILTRWPLLASIKNLIC